VQEQFIFWLLENTTDIISQRVHRIPWQTVSKENKKVTIKHENNIIMERNRKETRVVRKNGN